MQKSTLRIIGNKVVLNIRERMCETAEEMLGSEKFRQVLDHCIDTLKAKNSPLLDIFVNRTPDKAAVTDLVKTLTFLVKYENKLVPHIFENSTVFLRNLDRLAGFVEYLYDYWRSFDRFIVNDSEGDRLDKRPYRTFNETVEQLTHLVRTVYRQIQENIQEATLMYTGRFLQEPRCRSFRSQRKSHIKEKNTKSLKQYLLSGRCLFIRRL